MAKLSDLNVVLLDDAQTDEAAGYRGFGFYLVDSSQWIYAGPFRSRDAANAYLEDLWHEPRTG